jgi:hypothetical protein
LVLRRLSEQKFFGVTPDLTVCVHFICFNYILRNQIGRKDFKSLPVEKFLQTCHIDN